MSGSSTILTHVEVDHADIIDEIATDDLIAELAARIRKQKADEPIDLSPLGLASNIAQAERDYIERALDALRRRRPAEAEALLVRALWPDPDDPDAEYKFLFVQTQSMVPA